MLEPALIRPLVQAALQEDWGEQGDITSLATIPAEKTARATMRARKEGVVSGLKVAVMAFEIADPSLEITIHEHSGAHVIPGQDLITISGSARAILAAERVALNYISHLSGISTLAARYVDAVEGTNAKILDTRKTMPNLRALQKYAVKAGGGHNHRFGLYDAVLIKDNHIAIAGGIKPALEAAKAYTDSKIEIEVDTLAQLQEVLETGLADIVLLDNMKPEILRQAVGMADGRVLTEASGGINLDTVRAIAESGVDYISIGALTHSAPILDIGLDIDL